MNTLKESRKDKKEEDKVIDLSWMAYPLAWLLTFDDNPIKCKIFGHTEGKYCRRCPATWEV